MRGTWKDEFLIGHSSYTDEFQQLDSSRCPGYVSDLRMADLWNLREYRR
jgi:hypothetical protein